MLGPVALMLVAVGGLVDIELAGYAWWELGALVSLGAMFVLGLLFLLVLVTGQWWTREETRSEPWFFSVSAAVLCLVLQPFLKATFQLLIGLRPEQEGWLILLVLIPVIIYLSFGSLSGLGPRRRSLAIGLRCLLILFIVLGSRN